MRRSLLVLSLLFPLAAQACPDLQMFYADEQGGAQALEARLAPLMSQCLESSEYFALFGAAQLEAGKLAEALESLERSLLLDAGNGAAQIDYAQALYLRGQLFSALDLNNQLLGRPDLTSELRTFLEERHLAWQAQTRQYGWQADVLTGYDENLNGAPDSGQIALTLSGEPVVLNLNPEYQPISGAFLNLRLGVNLVQMAADHQHNAQLQLRGRVSKDSDSDFLQLESRYAYVSPRRDHTWQFDAGMSHLMFGGSPLYTATEAGARYSGPRLQSCRQHSALLTQHQLYHDQSRLNSLESKASLALECPWRLFAVRSSIGLEVSALHNQALNNGRPGGNRNGWQTQLDWQFPLAQGVMSAQLNHTTLDDKDGYSPLLANGAERWLRRSYVLLQYRQPLFPDAAWVVSVYHQRQRSNIKLFESLDTTLEVGVSLAF